MNSGTIVDSRLIVTVVLHVTAVVIVKAKIVHDENESSHNLCMPIALYNLDLLHYTYFKVVPIEHNVQDILRRWTGHMMQSKRVMPKDTCRFVS